MMMLSRTRNPKKCQLPYLAWRCRAAAIIMSASRTRRSFQRQMTTPSNQIKLKSILIDAIIFKLTFLFSIFIRHVPCLSPFTQLSAAIVPRFHTLQWDLVCENSFWRTTVATAVSVGKFIGATSFGIMSDKYGRKTSFILGSIFYISGSVLTTFSPWYWLFLIGRVLLGSSSSGLFYPAFSLCKYIPSKCPRISATATRLANNCLTWLFRLLSVTENIGSKHRSWMSIAFSMSYPIGMILLAISAHFIHAWRHLQLSLTVPAFLLVFYC